MKKLLLLCFLLAAGVAAFSLEKEKLGTEYVSFLTLEKPDFYITQQFEYNTMYDARSENTGISTIGVLDAKELLVQGGFSSNSKRTDLAVQFFYAPCWFNLVSAGVSGKYHYYKYSDVFAEHNVLGGFFVHFNIKNHWDLYTSLFYMWKFTIINTSPSKIHFTERSVALINSCVFRPDEFWNFYLDISSVSLFDDALIGSPMLNAGFNRQIWKNMSLGTGVYLKWTDASVLRSSFSAAGVRMNWTVKL